jgi:endoglucanase
VRGEPGRRGDDRGRQGRAQQWQVNGNGTFVNPNSGTCLDAVGQGTANGTRVQIWDCYGSGTQPNQVWSLR